MNYFPITGNFHGHLTAAPWLSIPTAVAAPPTSGRAAGGRGSKGGRHSAGSTTDLQATSTLDSPAVAKHLPFAPSMYLKSICNVHTGVGFIISDLVDAWVGYFSPQNVLSQLEERMPGVTIELVEALRMIERSVVASHSAANAGTGDDGRVHFALNGAKTSSWDPAGGGTVHMESALDLGLDERSVPLKVHLSFTMVHVSKVVSEGGTQGSRSIAASFIRDQFILPLMAVTQGSASLIDSLVREGSKYHPKGYAGMSAISSGAGVSTPVLVKDALVEATTEVQAPGSQKAISRGGLAPIGRHPSQRVALETRFLAPEPSIVPPTASQPTKGKERVESKLTGAKRASRDNLLDGGSDSLPGPGISLDHLIPVGEDERPRKKPRVETEDPPKKIVAKGGKVPPTGSPHGGGLQRTTSIYVETPEEIAQKKKLQDKLELERVQQSQAKQQLHKKPAIAAPPKVPGGQKAAMAAPLPKPSAKPADDKIKKIRKALL